MEVVEHYVRVLNALPFFGRISLLLVAFSFLPSGIPLFCILSFLLEEEG